MGNYMKPIYRKRIKTAAFIWAGSGVMALLAYIVILAPQAKTRSQIGRLLTEKKQTYAAAHRSDKAGVVS